MSKFEISLMVTILLKMNKAYITWLYYERIISCSALSLNSNFETETVKLLDILGNSRFYEILVSKETLSPVITIY